MHFRERYDVVDFEESRISEDFPDVRIKPEPAYHIAASGIERRGNQALGENESVPHECHVFSSVHGCTGAGDGLFRLFRSARTPRPDVSCAI